MRNLFFVIAVFLVPISYAQAQVENDTNTDRSLIIRALAILPGALPVHKELNLLDDQLREIHRLQAKFPETLRSRQKELARARGLERREIMDSLYRDLETELSQALLPKQLKRAKEIALQSLSLSESGDVDIARLLSVRPVKNELNISDSVIRELRRNAKSEQENLERQIQLLRNESRQRLLQTLPPNLQKKLNELTGAWFDFEGFVPGLDGKLHKPGSRDDH